MRRVRPFTGLLAGWLAACGGGGDGGAAPSPPATPDPFAAVDRAASAAFSAQGFSGMGVAVYDAQGTKRFERMYGSFTPDQRIAVASASKLVAGLTILRLVEQGYLSLDSTTGEVLGWTGPQAGITLRQLLSFTSGLPREAPCTLLQVVTLADCVDAISQMTPVAAPGTRFDWQGNRLIGDALFTTQGSEPFPNAVIGNSPFANSGFNFHYGLSAWLECPPPAANCAVLSSPGAFGFTPWVDRDGGYYAIIAMEVSEADSGIVAFSVQLAQDLKPLIRDAL